MSCPDCFRGSVHEGDPRGKVTHAYGLETYVVEPSNGQPPKGIVVLLPDGFGWEFVNLRLLADQYADMGGFKVYAPEFMNGKRRLYMTIRSEEEGGEPFMRVSFCLGVSVMLAVGNERLMNAGRAMPLSTMESMKIVSSPVGILTKMQVSPTPWYIAVQTENTGFS